MDRWWQRLASVRELEFQAVSPADRCNWNGEGSGDVRVEQQEAELLFHETGAWTPQGGRPIRFTNTYRWTMYHLLIFTSNLYSVTSFTTVSAF